MLYFTLTLSQVKTQASAYDLSGNETPKLES